MAAAVMTLLALCALLAGGSAARYNDNTCTTDTYGDTSNSLVPLKSIFLPPPTKTLTVETGAAAKSACGLYAHPVGLKVKSCDPEGPPPPIVKILSLDEAVVTRDTAAQTKGTFFSAVYCAPNTESIMPPAVVGGDGGVTVVPIN